jgi:hypothetical protein
MACGDDDRTKNVFITQLKKQETCGVMEKCAFICGSSKKNNPQKSRQMAPFAQHYGPSMIKLAR